ncbi:MAG: histidine ammonia-lyase [Gaiellaceae bacterium]|nr:histidine ammonia-lyase [Gaiellaceae bacterium]
MTVVVGRREALSCDDVVAVARAAERVELAPEAPERIAAARSLVERLVGGEHSVYGLNTGLGDLSQVRVPDEDLVTLQRNLVESHAAGVGEPLPVEVVRAMMLLLANSLAQGYSGVRPLVVEHVIELLNRGLVPVVPSRGSVGSSGDLAPLAHLARGLCGEGELVVDGKRQPADAALRDAGLEPLELTVKEGLALVNGTHLMAGTAALLVHDTRRLLDAAELAAALSLDVLLCSLTPMDDRIHALRRRSEQRRVATRVRALVTGSELLASHSGCGRVQDPYTLRCIPQVLGAAAEGLAYVESALAPELGAVTDNPLCFPEEGDVLSGGNFHGQPLSLALDVLAIVVAEIAAFSERRSFRLLADAGHERALPPFLSRRPGLESGMMILQYVAAALVAENQVLAHPAGTGSLPTSGGQEDFNSMGATAALKAQQSVANGLRVVAIELLCAAQALDLRRPLRSTAALEELHRCVRELSPAYDTDRSLSAEIELVAEAIAAGAFGNIAAHEHRLEVA